MNGHAEGKSTKRIAKERCLSSKTIEWHRGRIMKKPGIESIAGLAQIRGLYEPTPAQRLKYDILYIRNGSIRLSLYLLLQTIPVVVPRRGWR